MGAVSIVKITLFYSFIYSFGDVEFLFEIDILFVAFVVC